MTPENRVLTGWLSTRGEWTLFADRHHSRYDPYDRAEDAKCVSVVNGTGQPRAGYSRLNGRRVAIQGRAVDYDKLQAGDSAADRLLSKRYYAGEVVENACLRQHVFVATTLAER